MEFSEGACVRDKRVRNHGSGKIIGSGKSKRAWQVAFADGVTNEVSERFLDLMPGLTKLMF